jgi:UDP-glucose 4-epimerase
MNAAYSQAVDRDLPYVIAPRRAGDVPTCLADVRKAKEVLDFETQFGLADMCQSSWNWIETQARS